MFVFLTRLGRLVVGIPVVIAVTAILGINTLTALPAASKHKDPGSCTVAMGAVINGHQRLLVTAVGLAPGSSYVYGQTGVQTANVTTNSTGAFSDQSLFYHGAGTYSIAIDYYYWSNNRLVQATATSCSARL